METLISSILTNNGFIFNDTINGYHLEDKAYFFTRIIGSDELEEIKNKSSMDDSTWYQEFISSFNAICENTDYPALEKNSSLLVIVEALSITDLDRLQSQILLLEEDQFYIKKYVIVFTKSSFAKISELTSNEQLQSAVNNSKSFNSLMTQGLSQEIEDYLLLLQLFIKLPFLKLRFENETFIGLPEKLRKVLSTDMEIYERLLDFSEELHKLNFLDSESDSGIDNLITLVSNDSN